MFARVPGPADGEATLATISAYSTSVIFDTAWTIGIVAWPPQVIRETLGASRWAPRLTAGTTAGPSAAGVRSTAWMPRSWYRGAFRLCTEAEVASNTRSGLALSRSQSTPRAEAVRPRSAARLRPGLSGSTPIIQRGSMTSERSSLYIRSVPMLPEPTIAAVALVALVALVTGSPSFEVGGHGAESGELGPEGLARSHVDRPGARAGQDDVAGLELHPEGGDLARQPGDGGGRVAENGAGVAAG